MNNNYLPYILAALLCSLALSAHAETKRMVIMTYQLVGDKGSVKLSAEHQQRLTMADAALRRGLGQKPQYALIDVDQAKAYSKKVDEAHHNNACQGCEVAFAKEIKADFILAPWVYRVSSLILAMHFDLIDVNNGKRVYEKILDFRGDNDQSWQRAIEYFSKEVDKPVAQ